MKDSLLYSLHKLVALIDRQSDEALQEHFGWGFSQFRILMGAKYRAGLTQSDIAHYLGQTEASVSRQLKLMRVQGLIRVKQDAKNRRKHIVVLTEKGLEQANEATSLLQEAHAGVFGSLSFKEQALIKELIDRLTTKASQKND